MLKNLLTARKKQSHKGNYGHVLVIGGDKGMPGAPVLVTKSVALMGAGLTTVLTRPKHVITVTCHHPEALCFGFHAINTRLLNTRLKQASVIVLGPGLGLSFWSKILFRQTLKHVCKHQLPTVIDADALNLIAKGCGTVQHLKHAVYTPHPGEAARLLTCTIKDIQANREGAVQKLHKKLGGTIVLKGENSLVYHPDEPLYVCKYGNPGMATGGMGDLLSGLIGGLMTQGLTPFQAAKAAVELHAKAGDAALKHKGGPSVLATDLLAEIKPLFNR